MNVGVVTTTHNNMLKAAFVFNQGVIVWNINSVMTVDYFSVVVLVMYLCYI